VLERYYRELLNFCTRAVRDRDTAADVVQESYARVLAVQRSGQPIPEPRALLHQTARRLVIDLHRRLEVRQHVDLDGLAEQDQPASPQHLQPDAVYAYEQLARAMVAAIEALPPRCREAFVLNRFDGLSHQEVAERMGISKNMVAQHVMRGVLVCKACEDRRNHGTAASAVAASTGEPLPQERPQ
jgi:RNA polymerase sigma-70 factor (ECF subfamily)